MRTFLAALILCASISAARAGDIASCYGPESGLRTASGERFNWHAMTAAMLSTRERPIPFGTMVRVTYQGRSIVVRINDRGPFVRGRTIDLSHGACERIGLIGPGHGQVQLEIMGARDLYIPKHGDFGAF